MVVIQDVAAEIGRVTGRGIAAQPAPALSAPLLWFVGLLLLVANVDQSRRRPQRDGRRAASCWSAAIAVLYTLAVRRCSASLLEIFLNYPRYAAS